MNIKSYFKISLGLVAVLAAQISCVHDDNWDAPEITCNNKFDQPTKTMAQVAALAPAGDTITISNKANAEPVIFDGYVVSSDEQGNFYKTISFQDKPENPTMGLQIEINKSMNYADFPIGAHIRIKANGLVIGTDAGVIKLGARDPNYKIGRIPQTIVGRYVSGVCDGNGRMEIAKIVPRVVNLGDINKTSYINTLVTAKDVQFVSTDIGKELMNKDASGAYIDTDRKIVDKYGSTATIRTDGFFKAGGYKIPNKYGDITFVVNRFNTSYQNIIRTLSDINFTTDGTLPTAQTIFNESFPSNYLTANGWTAYNVAGSQVWGTTNFGNPAPSAYISGLGAINEDWLISKSISLTGFSAFKFYFETDVRYAGNPLEVYVTTDTYSGQNPNTLTWTKLDAYVDTDIAAFGGFVGSGIIDLAPYLNKNVRFGFKYTTPSASVGSAVEIDNVKVYAIP